MGKIAAIWQMVKLSRAPNLLIIVFTQYMVAIFLISGTKDWMSIVFDGHFFIVVFSTVVIAAAGYFINDYYDIKIDLINKPDKVIVGNKLQRRTVMLWHTCLNFAGIILGAWINIWIGMVNFIAAFSLWLYSNDLKRRPFIGNFTVALLTALSLIIVAVYYNTHELVVYIYAFFAFGITLIREIIKDLEDIKGDSAFGAKSLPIVLGIRRAKLVIYSLLIIFIISLVIFVSKESNSFLTNYFLLLLIPGLYISYKIYLADTKKHFNVLSQHLKWIILSGIVSMLFLN